MWQPRRRWRRLKLGTKSRGDEAPHNFKRWKEYKHHFGLLVPRCSGNQQSQQQECDQTSGAPNSLRCDADGFDFLRRIDSHTRVW